MVDWMGKVDPRRHRSLFVYTKFYSNALQYFASGKEVDMFLSGTPAPNCSFFVSTFSSSIRAKYSDKESFEEKIITAFQRDMSLLEQLKYDKTFAKIIGAHTLKRHLLERTWKHHHEKVPSLLKYLSKEKKDVSLSIDRVGMQLDDLQTHKLRSIASSYLIDFLHTISRIINGTAEGLPTVYGETSKEERIALGSSLFSLFR